jgi:hypothetical protein
MVESALPGWAIHSWAAFAELFQAPFTPSDSAKE